MNPRDLHSVLRKHKTLRCLLRSSTFGSLKKVPLSPLITIYLCSRTEESCYLMYLSGFAHDTLLRISKFAYLSTFPMEKVYSEECHHESYQPPAVLMGHLAHLRLLVSESIPVVDEDMTERCRDFRRQSRLGREVYRDR
jgi:hypothetical protein